MLVPAKVEMLVFTIKYVEFDIYSVSQKKSPVRLSEFFQKRLRIFNRFLHTYYAFLCTLDYKFLLNYLQL